MCLRYANLHLIQMLVVPDPEGLERLNVGDLVQDRSVGLDDVQAEWFDVLLGKF